VTASELPEQPPSRPPQAPKQRSRLRNLLFAIGIIVVKVLKYLLLPFKLLKGAKFVTTFLTMGLTMAVYASRFGWQFAVGLVMLIFIHEMGHAAAVRMSGLRAGAPVFIPFIGAFITLRDQPHDVLTEAKIAIAGPLVGAAAAAACLMPYRATGHPLWLVLANTGFMLNLFNLIPFGPLDGGRTAQALSRRLWIVGVVLLGAAIVIFRNWFLLIIVLLAIPYMQNKAAMSPQERIIYYDIPARARAAVAALYFGLAAALGVAMMLVGREMELIRHAGW
jgi:Zn-dependent protease